MMAALRSMLFNIAFYIFTAMVAIGGLPFLLGPRDWARTIVAWWARGTQGLLHWIVGVKLVIEGREHVPDGPCIIAPKHQSAWETISFFYLARRPAFVMKQVLVWLPFVGLYLLRMGLIPIDRTGHAKALRKMMAAANKAAKDGRDIVVFAEGTRTAVGEQPALKPGVVGLYRTLGLPLVPVALNSGPVWDRRSFRKSRGVLTVRFMPALPPGLKKDELLSRLHQAINADPSTGQLVQQAVKPGDKQTATDSARL
jgi:1-acyl-sn-glycerol-3-phosphate acyltransferase